MDDLKRDWPPTRPDVSVLIVCYDSLPDIDRCLRSLRSASEGLHTEVILIDNGVDGSADHVRNRYPEVVIMPNDRNLGFAGGNNRCAAAATGRFLLLLNPDTQSDTGSIVELVRAAERDPGAGIYGGVTRFPDGRPEPSCSQPSPGLRSEFLRLVGLAGRFRGGIPEGVTAPRPVSVTSGAFMLVRAETWDRLGGFDERLWLYSEEVDLCLRARQLGERVMMTPHASVVHFVGQSSSSSGARLVAILKGKMHLNRKFHTRPHTWLLGSVLWLQVLSRVLAGSLITPVAVSTGRRLKDENRAALDPRLWWTGLGSGE